MKNRISYILILFSLFTVTMAQGGVILNEVFINPPGSSADAIQEFIELLGTPGMKLDGYSVAFINGAQRKNHPDNPIPPNCTDDPSIAECTPEIDEFFSLDGLSLGANGILVVAHGPAILLGSPNYPTILSDSNVRYSWETPPVWNGFLDTPGKLSNDGSNTVVLIRNRPGSTQANCPTGPCPTVRWGKDVPIDREVLPMNPPTPGMIQYGNGDLDKGEPNPPYANTLDIKGASTPADITDDLEIVDEVSYSSGGWEYDEDDRHADVGSLSVGLPRRKVHSLTNPHGFTPDCLSRVDYRTKGAGWLPFPGATGEMGNGNNWQDTATEQWIRGESIGTGPGNTPPYFYDISADTDPDAIQPYLTQVPLWLNDGQAPDFNFASVQTYQIMAGRINPLAVPFIPGDADRDGDCDTDDISKIAAVFGNDNWIFSNSFESAPESDSGDPATQTRPWDVDATGNNGIEPSDLQWTLNFQGDTTGRVVGVRYDSTTPTPVGSGVALNSNAGTTCTITTVASNPCARALNGLFIGDTVDLTVRAQVTGGANLTSGNENGVMQFVQDLTISSGGVLRVVSVQSLGVFSTTRAGIETLQGVSGDLGIKSINGYATSFTQGLGATASLYHVTLKAVGAGTVNVSVVAASLAKFAASTPGGLKIGHTGSNGNPASVVQAPAVAITVTNTPVGDVNGDNVLNVSDAGALVNVLLGIDVNAQHIAASDINCDGLVNGRDVASFIPLLVP